jgi:SAM-dependent methyltransferase
LRGWDERYAQEGYAYGTEPNRWLRAQAGGIRAGGRVLCLAEGEGRNAVWLAGQGLRVDAVDGSAVGLEKARRLAAQRGVSISTAVADLAGYQPAPGAYDGVVLVFAHLPPSIRPAVHARAVAALVPGGLLIVEAFTPAQLARSSGGPKQPDLLYDEALLRRDLEGLRWEVLREEEVELDEGQLHRGPAAVVHGVGRRSPPSLGSKLTPP